MNCKELVLWTEKNRALLAYTSSSTKKPAFFFIEDSKQRR